MAALKLDELLTLDVEGRLAVIEKLWDSIVNDSKALPITEGERELLARRLKEDEDDPGAALPWEIARAELLRSR